MLQHAEDCISSRAVFVFIAFMDHERTRDLVAAELKKHKAFAEQLKKKQGSAAGLDILLKKLQ